MSDRGHDFSNPCSRDALFLRLAFWTYDRRDGPKTLAPNFFPRRHAASSRALRSKIVCPSGPSLRCGPYGFRAVAAVMDGPASPEEQASGETQRRKP
jgi:hypothetical protein